MQGKCRICGQSGTGRSFDEWVRPTFTNWDKLQSGDIICAGCLFWFDEQSEKLACITGKDRPQRMRNYSHFILGGEWIPLSKGDKSRMQDLLLGASFPELAVVAESGQKHIVFQAPRNLPGARAGWVQLFHHLRSESRILKVEIRDVAGRVLVRFHHLRSESRILKDLGSPGAGPASTRYPAKNCNRFVTKL